jgi:hypothetical protein
VGPDRSLYGASVLNKWILAVGVASFMGILALLAIAGFFAIAIISQAHPAAIQPSSSDCSLQPGMRPAGCNP